MKKNISIVCALVLVLALSISGAASQTVTGSIAKGPVAGETDVKLNILHYIEFDIPTVIDLGDIDFSSENFGRTVANAPFALRTNGPVVINISSRGFQDKDGEPNETLNSWIAYSALRRSNYFTAGGNMNSMNYQTEWTGSEITDNIQVRFNTDPLYGGAERVDSDNFLQVKRGEYTDVLTITVSGR